MADQNDDRKLEMNGPGPLNPGPASAPAKFPVPILLDLHGAQLRIAARERLYAPVAVMRAIYPGASTASEPLLRPNPPDASRHAAVERGYAGIEEPFPPEQLCRRLTGLLASPRVIASKKEH